MKTKLCKCCGHPVPVDDVAATLTGKARKLYEIIEAAGRVGITRDRAAGLLYADDPDGGPLTHPISQWKWIVNGIIRTHGLEITSTRGPAAVYRLEAIATRNPGYVKGRYKMQEQAQPRAR